MRKKKLGEVLRERRHISGEVLDSAIEEQKRKLGRLGELLLHKGAVQKDALVAALEEVTGASYVDASTAKVDPEVLELVPRELAQRHGVLPLERKGKTLVVVMADPQNLHVLDELRFATGSEISPRMGFAAEVARGIARIYGGKLPSAGEVVDVEQSGPVSDIEFFTAGTSQRHEDAIREFQRELRNDKTPAVHVVSAILAEAAERKASDVHIEQQARGTLVRIRVDGVLRELTRITPALRSSVVSRIKILSDMDISERRIPQDGRLLARVGQAQYDLRISTLPTQYGEKINIRLLDPTAVQVRFEDLGFPPELGSSLRRLLTLPQGMILVTGPTGAGKSTTLYAAINLLRSPDVSILTVEDPVEYMIEGVNQVQVNPRAGRTFAACLRSMLRQDPNIIMVGEIRDPETAEIALQVSQTGHMVLSTLHTNDSIGAITRMLDLNQPGFLIASSVTAVVAQRLVRRLCACRQEAPPTLDQVNELAKLGMERIPDRIAVPRGCSQCDQTGYKGRIGVYEMLVLDDDLRRSISSGGRDDELRALARSRGIRTMQQDAFDKIRAGITTLAEVRRVVPFENLTEDCCPHCGNPLVSSFVYCPYCSAKVKLERSSSSSSSSCQEPVTGGIYR